MENPPRTPTVIDIIPESVVTTEHADLTSEQLAQPVDHAVNPAAEIDIYQGPKEEPKNSRKTPYESSNYQHLYDTGTLLPPLAFDLSSRAIFDMYTGSKDKNPVEAFSETSIVRHDMRRATTTMLNTLEGPSADAVREAFKIKPPVKKEGEKPASLFTPEQQELAAVVSGAILQELTTMIDQRRLMVEPGKFATEEFQSKVKASLEANGLEVNAETFKGVFETLLPALKDGYDTAKKQYYIPSKGDYDLAA